MGRCWRNAPMARPNEPFVLCLLNHAILCLPSPAYTSRRQPLRLINKTSPIQSDICSSAVGIRLCISSICMQRKQNARERENGNRFDFEEKKSHRQQQSHQREWRGIESADFALAVLMPSPVNYIHISFATNCYCLRHIQSIF